MRPERVRDARAFNASIIAVVQLADSSMSTRRNAARPIAGRSAAAVRDVVRASARSRVQPNPDAMVLASTDEKCRPSARVVLCKRLALDEGYIVFFTNYESHKGQRACGTSARRGRVALGRTTQQVRIEGPMMRSPEGRATSTSRVARSTAEWRPARALRVSRSRRAAALVERVRKTADAIRHRAGTQGREVPRPAHWGGLSTVDRTIELWTEGANRVHDRAVWTRTLQQPRSSRSTPGPGRVRDCIPRRSLLDDLQRRLGALVVVAAAAGGSLGPGGGCGGGASASEKIIPCPVSRA